MLSKLMSLLIKRNFVFIGMCQWQQTHNYLGFPKGESKVKNALRYFYFFCFCVQSQIAVWALKRMRACLIRGQGIDLQGFNQMQYCMQSLGSFHCIPPRASFVKLAHWYAMALLAVNCLFAQNSEMEVRTFVRIQSNLGPLFCWLLRLKLSRSKVHFNKFLCQTQPCGE